MSVLLYSSKRGASIGHHGTAAELGKKLERLKVPAIMRSNHHAVIGEKSRCDGTCDGNCRGWHWWYDPTGDDVTPDTGGMANDATIERSY